VSLYFKLVLEVSVFDITDVESAFYEAGLKVTMVSVGQQPHTIALNFVGQVGLRISEWSHVHPSSRFPTPSFDHINSYISLRG